MGKEETRRHILEAARTLFSQRGFQSSTTKEIAAEAGVNELTVFRHFGNKEALLREAIQMFSPTSILDDKLERKLSGELREDLIYLGQAYLSIVLSNVDSIRIGMLEGPLHQPVRDIISQIPERLKLQLSGYLNRQRKLGRIQEVNTELIAELFYTSLFSHVMAQAGFPTGSMLKKVSPEELVHTVVSVYADHLEREDAKAEQVEFEPETE